MQENLFKREALLIENDFFQSQLYSDVLCANNFEVSLVKSAIDGLQKLKSKDYDIAIMNIDIGQPSFIEKILKKMRNEKPNVSIVGLSIYDQENKKNVAVLLNKFLTKPFSIDTLMGYVVMCVENGCENSCSGRAQA